MTSISALDNSWRYLRSWTNADEELEGIIATYWDSSASLTVPHLMNHFPVIEALCDLYQRFGNPVLLERARAYAEFFIRHREADGIFGHAWGDVPPKGTGTVHQAAASAALLSLADASQDQRYLQLAVENLQACQQRWPGILLNGVANQAMKYIQALMQLRALSPEDYHRVGAPVDRYVAETQAIITPARWGGRFIDQSAYNNFWMSCYEAKCLHGLSALASAGVHADWAIETMNGVVEALVNNLHLGNGLYVSHADYVENTPAKLLRMVAGVARRLPLGARAIEVERMRRKLIAAVSAPVNTNAPVWLARMADTAYIFSQVKPWLAVEIDDVQRMMHSQLLDNQQAHGGVPNVIGPWMSGMHAWERQVCSTRWNAYVFRYFAQQSTVDLDPGVAAHTGEVQREDDFVLVTENPERVVAEIKASRARYQWDKPAR